MRWCSIQFAFSAALWLSHVDPIRDLLERVWGASTLFVMGGARVRAAGAVFTWLERRPREEHAPVPSSTLPVLRRIVKVVIALVGMMLVLDPLGVAIGPLLAGLGIGGIAVALAAQGPILANIFAWFLHALDRSIAVGDPHRARRRARAGRVEDIGLRATHIRTLRQQPRDSSRTRRLASATVTNFDWPTLPPSGARVSCGIAFEENLTHVEAV